MKCKRRRARLWENNVQRTMCREQARRWIKANSAGS